MSSKIRYTPPSVGSLEILTIRGTITGGQMRTLSSLPVVVLPAGSVPSGRTFVPLYASADMKYATTNLIFPMCLTWDLSLVPFFQMNPQVLGGGMVTAAMAPDPSTGFGVFEINNINTGTAATNIVWKAIANSPGADFDEVNYEIVYVLGNALTT